MLKWCKTLIILHFVILISSALVASDNDENTNTFLKYVETYQSFEEKTRTGASSSNGDHDDGSDAITSTSPVFMELVARFQQLNKMEVTGVLNDEVIEAMGKSRCGMNDEPPSGSGPASYTAHSKWVSNHNVINDKYELSYSFFPKTFPSSLRDIDIRIGVLAAMCTWELNSKIRFHQDLGDNSDRADVRISFGTTNHGDGFDFDGRGGTLAHAFYPENGRLHFDSDESWFLANKNEYDSKRDIFTVAAHELGHCIGLAHSDTRGALMAPLYDFQGPFSEYKLPIDDIEGVTSIYGPPSRSNPKGEAYSACKTLQNSHPKSVPDPSHRPTTNSHPRPHRRTTTSTTTTTTRAPRRPSGNAGCGDVRLEFTCSLLKDQGFCADIAMAERMKKSCAKTCNFCTGERCADQSEFRSSCRSWKEAGYCTNPVQGPSMSRMCKKTCGFCRDTQPQAKPKEPPVTAKSVCDIESFDSFVTIYDSYANFDAYIFKDNSYFPLQSQLRSHGLSLLDDERLDGMIRWRYDPKTVTSGVFVIGSSSRDSTFQRSESVSAVIWSYSFYIVFNKNGVADEYQRSGPRLKFIVTMKIRRMFPGYPHDDVDAGFLERKNRKTTYLLFRKDQFWTFEADNPRDGQRHTFTMTSDGADIMEWQGVPACGVDAVFEYKDKPYFLKGTTFWPANSSEPVIHRDITHNKKDGFADNSTVACIMQTTRNPDWPKHFFRCWQTAPTEVKIHHGCNSSWKIGTNFLLVVSLLTLHLLV